MNFSRAFYSCQRSDFRSSLAESIATAHATQRLRKVSSDETPGQPPQNYSIAESSRALLEGFSEIAILFLDLSGVIQNWSAGANRVLGYSSDEVLGNRLDLFFEEGAVLRGQDTALVERARIAGRSEVEVWLYRADKTCFWGKVIVTSFNSLRGDHVGFSIVVQNVTK